MCRYGLSDECSITGRDIYDVKDTIPEGCPVVDYDVEKVLFLIRFLEKVRNHILSKERVEEIDLGLFSRKVRYTPVITEQNLKYIIDRLRERVEHAQA